MFENKEFMSAVKFEGILRHQPLLVGRTDEHISLEETRKFNNKIISDLA